ncbi:MAG: M42 family peptidase [Gemmatimonadota bacterium]
MNAKMKDFLSRLLDAHGPSGQEGAAVAVWREEAASFAQETWGDVHGNSFALINPDGSPSVMLAGHIDEIGFIVHHIDDAGYLWVKAVGGWDAQVLVGQRVDVLTAGGPVIGVVGRSAIHLLEREALDKAVKLKDLWIDIGASDGDEARARVAIGDVGVIRSDTVELANGRIAARSVDDRVGAAVVLEALRIAADGGCAARVVAVATTQEEISYVTGGGARTGSFGLDPSLAVVVDVTHAIDHPGVDHKEHGAVKLGGGPVLGRGAAVNPVVYERLAAAAGREGIDVQVQALPAMTGTDADAIRMARAGVATGIVSIPNRYMHSPNQIVTAGDVEASARLIGSFLADLADGDSFLPH